MNEVKLHKEFVRELQQKIPQRSELINVISDILHLEKEPVSRRLSQRVNFTVSEMGILARELNISLDALLYRESQIQWVPLILESPHSVKSIDELCDIIDSNCEEMNEISEDPCEFGTVFNSYPIEYYMHHPSLMKFMFFKWGHYFVGTEEFDDFAKWKLPNRLENLKDRLDNIFDRLDKVLYIWDETLIWTLVNEIDFFYRMEILNSEDLLQIKKDLKESLVNLEKYISGLFNPEKASRNVSFYVSNMNLGVTGTYMFSEKNHLYSFKTNFTFLSSDRNYNNFYEIRKWINSFKNISVLISDSGPLERKSFFVKQHKIIDDF